MDTIIHTTISGKYAGHIVIANIVKSNSKEAIWQLKATASAKTMMPTSDAKKAANQVTASLELDEVYYELLLADKVEVLLQAKSEREKPAFAGDGITPWCRAGQISASPWVLWISTLPLRPPMWSS